MALNKDVKAGDLTPVLLGYPEVAARLSISVRLAKELRMKGGHPLFNDKARRISKNGALYWHIDDVDEWAKTVPFDRDLHEA